MKANQVSARIVLSDDTEALLDAWIKSAITADGAAVKADGAKGKLIDSAYADGVRGTHLRVNVEGDKKTKNPEFQKELRDHFADRILALYPKDVRNLVRGKDAKRKFQNRTKSDWIRVLGGRMNDLVKGLERREADARAEEAEDVEDAEDSGSSAQATLNSRLLKEIDAIVTRVEKTEGTDFDKFFVLKELRAVRAHIAARDAGIGADEGDDE